jgi:hypothetical protein
MRNNITIPQLMSLHRKTIHELIEMIKLHGEVVEINNSVLTLPNDKFAERALLLFNGLYFVTYVICDNFEERCPWEDIAVFRTELTARANYNSLLQILNAEVL